MTVVEGPKGPALCRPIRGQGWFLHWHVRDAMCLFSPFRTTYRAYRYRGGTVGTWVFGTVGAVAFLTGVTGFCLLDRVVHVFACPTPP